MSKLISLFDVSMLIDPLTRGHLVLTANQRLASRIRNAWAIHCREQGERVINAPAVYSLHSWIERNWKTLLLQASDCVLRESLLTNTQEQALWERIVSSSSLGSALLRPTATAQQAISAYRTMVEWRQDFSATDIRAQFNASEDCAAFLSWVDEFEQLCQQQQWLPPARQPERLIEAFDNGELEPTTSITTVGFETITPLHNALLHSAGGFTPLASTTPAGEVSVVACDDTRQEMLSAAIWAKKILRDDPQATVALVIPDLTQQRQSVQRILQEVFEPAFNQPGQARHNLPFNFSAGYPLLEAPVISAAINALQLCSQPLALDVVIALCQSPFYCLDTGDHEAIAHLVALLHNEGDYVISAARLRQLARTVSDARLYHGASPSVSDAHQHETGLSASNARQHEVAPSASNTGLHEARPVWLFAAALQQQANCAREAMIEKPRLPSQWLPLLQQLLAAMGWPGQRSLDSIEYQQVTQWQQALENLGSLDTLAEPMSFTRALACLRTILVQHIFQPQTADSSLQVLGTLEAAGLQFSHIWLQSMSARQWPAQPAANALLPARLQRERKMPHASAERELEYAIHLAQRFIHSASTIVVSYPATMDDNPTSVSELFSQYRQTTMARLLGRELASLIPGLEIRRRHMDSVVLQPYDQGNAPPLSADEQVSGGSQLFSSQSACAFRAFATHRLHLRALPAPAPGFTRAERGSLLHRALELIWEKLKCWQNLQEQTEQALATLCATVADYALQEFVQRTHKRQVTRYCQLESARLQTLLLTWLDIEKQRAPFVVERIESRQTFRFAELQLQTRIDRIDRLADGSLLILDYKTGNCSIQNWWGMRPGDPQLPLYSLLTENALNASEAALTTGQTETGDTVAAATAGVREHLSATATAGTKECVSATATGGTRGSTSATATAAGTVGAIAFAQIRTDGCDLKGIGAEQLPEPMLQWHDKIKTDAGVQNWQALKHHWQTVLGTLAKQFIAGNSAVDPEQVPQTCQYCDLASVCRINHQELQA